MSKLSIAQEGETSFCGFHAAIMPLFDDLMANDLQEPLWRHARRTYTALHCVKSCPTYKREASMHSPPCLPPHTEPSATWKAREAWVPIYCYIAGDLTVSLCVSTIQRVLLSIGVALN